MIRQKTIKQRRPKRVARIRSIIHGTSDRPRLVIYRSNTGLYAQCIDDSLHGTLVFAKQKGTNRTSAIALGSELVSLCKTKKIKQVVFDRGGYKYHGVIKQIADTVREGGVRI